MNDYFAWFDGACGPINPGGTAMFGVVVRDDNGTVLLKEHGLVGQGITMSNNVAEYAGVLHILKYLSCRPPGRATIHGDANLVISQLSGKWRVRKGLYLPIAMEAKALLANLHGLGWDIDLRWIPREQNEECDALSKKGCPSASKPSSTQQMVHPRRGKVHERRVPRGKSMLGRTIKTTGITVLRAAPQGEDGTSTKWDWWVCKCPCGREFIGHGWNVRHGRTRNCGGDEHNVLSKGVQPTVLALDKAQQQPIGMFHNQPHAIPLLLAGLD